MKIYKNRITPKVAIYGKLKLKLSTSLTVSAFEEDSYIMLNEQVIEMNK